MFKNEIHMQVGKGHPTTQIQRQLNVFTMMVRFKDEF